MLKNGLSITAALGGVMAARILGLAVVIPTLSLYAVNLPYGSPTLAGATIGIYGLTQALLQIPFGALSDKIGRKTIVLIGLTLFVLGSVLAANVEDGWLLLLARALQGGGAIAAAINAWVTDVTHEKQRTAGMAILGASVGMTFLLALILGAPLVQWLTVPGVFWLSAGCGIIAMLVVLLLPPPPNNSQARRIDLKFLLARGDLQLLCAGVFVLHASLAAVFYVVPLWLNNNNTGTTYLWPLLIGAIIGLGSLRIVEKRRLTIFGFILMGILTSIGLASLIVFELDALLPGLALFFIGFVFLEAALPSTASKRAPEHAKGSAMGAYSSAQFMGIFVGGSLAGWLHANTNLSVILIVVTGLLGLWTLMLALRKQSLGQLPPNT